METRRWRQHACIARAKTHRFTNLYDVNNYVFASRHNLEDYEAAVHRRT